MVYLDNNATTPPTPEVIAAMLETLQSDWGNPSSMHRVGQAARRRVELARRSVAALLGATPREIVFTGGGTESIDAAIRGSLATQQDARRNVLITTGVEHAAVSKLATAITEHTTSRVQLVPLLPGGIVDVPALAEMMNEHTALVSVQWANNETGAIQPVEAIGDLCKQHGIPFHCDATQWIGKAPADVTSFNVDLLTCSAHKFHGPKGVGVLYIRRGARCAPVLHGSQELGRRGGTENTTGIVGMGVAAEQAREWLNSDENPKRMEALRNRFEQTICERIEGASVNKPEPPNTRLWNTANIAFEKLEAEALLMLLSEQGVCASAGSACASGSLEGSPVLKAMGVPETQAHGSLRFSLSRETTHEEIDEAIEIIEASVARLRESSSAALR